MKKIDVACGVVINDKGQYLIAQRGDGKYAEKWEFAGGKLNLDETPFEAIKRELKEELNITALPLRELFRSVFQDYNLIFIECKYISSEIQLKEHKNCAWATKTELSKYEFLEGDVEFLNNLNK